MEKDYIKIYEENYAKSEISAEKEIKKKYIEFKVKGRNHLKATNVILKDFDKENQNSILKKDPYNNLRHLFINRLDEFDKKNQMNVIHEIIFPKFNELDNDFFANFEKFIVELAVFNARFDIYNEFSNNIDFYAFLFELNDFKDFKIKDFKINQDMEIYERYRLKVSKINNPELYLNTIREDKYISSSNLKGPAKPTNNFNFSDHKKKIITDKSFYNQLSTNYFDKTELSFKHFQDIFLMDFNSTKYSLRFKCDNDVACYILDELRLKFKTKNFTQTTISNSGKFKFADLKNISQYEISRYRSKIHKTDAEDVDCILNQFF